MGRFLKEPSGNRGSRPKIIPSVRKLAQGETARSIQVLVIIDNDEQARHAARIAAARGL